jgi:hypothetical protein
MSMAASVPFVIRATRRLRPAQAPPTIALPNGSASRPTSSGEKVGNKYEKSQKNKRRSHLHLGADASAFRQMETESDRWERAGIEDASVASDLLGKSGRAMLDALASGTTDPADYFTGRRDPARHAQRLIYQLGSLGYQVTVTSSSASEPGGGQAA